MDDDDDEEEGVEKIIFTINLVYDNLSNKASIHMLMSKQFLCAIKKKEKEILMRHKLTLTLK